MLEKLPKNWVIVHGPNIPVTLILTFDKPLYHLLEYWLSKRIVKVKYVVSGIAVKVCGVRLDAAYI